VSAVKKLADESLRAMKESLRCPETIRPRLHRYQRCVLIRGHATKHVAQYRAGAYRWEYIRIWGEGSDPFPPVEYEEAPCDRCKGTGIMQRVKL
jgi:hypothetical protein